MVAQLNGKFMNQLAIFFSILIIIKFLADVTGLTQSLGMYYSGMLSKNIAYTVFGLSVIFTILGIKKELSKYAIISLCLAIGIQILYAVVFVVLWMLAGTP
ncbi:TPA: hypothetical protein ACGXMA_002252 [Bacillus cereus]|uniref:Membrane protein n=2 Tax=Bacillus cereus TaxID=1396 RepID=A0AAN0T0R3_BACCE|nr:MULTISPECIES: hypothetical protein [Bacillus cereus group]ACO26244.1 conserved hypothetical protein [Bacillus cereus 03BB102]AEW54210.1 Hypothetical protein bcf_05435 [Bacillus cereus F837/76]AJG54485.1 putative membrane protein [Bacillus cereus 03BB102]AJI13816.1 putative membrane protein [Bacillus cereus 03BB108]EDX63556.1 conserved hypothetical protein [Bacillus cereus 03BB108]